MWLPCERSCCLSSPPRVPWTDIHSVSIAFGWLLCEAKAFGLWCRSHSQAGESLAQAKPSPSDLAELPGSRERACRRDIEPPPRPPQILCLMRLSRLDVPAFPYAVLLLWHGHYAAAWPHGNFILACTKLACVGPRDMGSCMLPASSWKGFNGDRLRTVKDGAGPVSCTGAHLCL